MNTAIMDFLLQVKNLSKSFGGLRAVDNVSFRVAEKELIAIIGPNGAGKTTLFNLIACSLPPTNGSVEFLGQKMKSAHQAARMGLARTFQNVRLFSDMTCLENVLVGMAQPGFISASVRLPSLVDDERRRMRQALRILEDVGLENEWNKRARDLPFGKQRLLEIARTMAIKPKLLLLDEPAAGLNRTETADLAKLVRRLRIELNAAILVIEHDMHFVMNLAERVIVLDNGRKIAEGTPTAVASDPSVIAAYLGSE